MTLRRLGRFVLFLTGCACALAPAYAAPVTLPAPRPIDVTKKGDVRLKGTLTAYDEAEIHVVVDGKEQRVAWMDLVPGSAFRLRSTLIDPKKADQWVALGEFGWGLNLKEQAESAFRSAAKLDPASAAKADAIRATPPGSLVKPAGGGGGGGEARPSNASVGRTPGGGEVKPAKPGDPKVVSGGESPSSSAGLPDNAEMLRPKGEVAPTKYQKATPEEDKAAIEEARKTAGEVGAKLNVKLAELQTDHFLIFTDWDPAEYGFLKRNLELAYAAVSKHFDIPVKENIFVGKLPVYMFARQATFKQFALSVDEAAVPDGVAGYYRGRSDGFGHMTMWKPDVQRHGLAQAEVQWAYVLTHEFTHAFVARYRSNVFIPYWLNEGIAEIIASQQFPAMNRRRGAHDVARAVPSIQPLFTTQTNPPGPMYPVMQTLVETLAANGKDRKTFLNFFNDIKDGTAVEESLKKHYATDFAGLEQAWRVYLDRTRNVGR